MHEIQPFYSWLDDYQASKDKLSPFYKRRYSEFVYSQKIYNYYIHPQWDNIGSETLYIKILFVDYEQGYAIIELIGEWNDCISSDIMALKRKVIDVMLENGVYKYILIGENILNFHGEDDCYYEDWKNDLADYDGWIVPVNFRPHIIAEMEKYGIHYYFSFCFRLNADFQWRKLKPQHIFEVIERERSLLLE